VDNESDFADAFARGFDKAPWPERRLHDKNGVASAGVGFDARARRLAANFLVGGPQEHKALSEGDF